MDTGFTWPLHFLFDHRLVSMTTNQCIVGEVVLPHIEELEWLIKCVGSTTHNAPLSLSASQLMENGYQHVCRIGKRYDPCKEILIQILFMDRKAEIRRL